METEHACTIPAGSLAGKVPQQLCTPHAWNGLGLGDFEFPSRVDFHRLAQNQEGAKLHRTKYGQPRRQPCSTPRAPGTWPRGRDRPFQVLDPPWRSLEPGGNAQQAGFWRYRWRTERMAIRYDRPQQERQTGEDAGGVLECENLECENKEHPRKEHPRLEQEDKKNDRKQKTNNRKLSVIRQRRHGRDLRFGFFTARSLPSQSPLSSARSRPYAALPGR